MLCTALLALAGSAKCIAATINIYGNASPITINDNAPASIYPSVINVSNIPGNVITKASIQLTGFTHAWPSDVDIVLVAPDGTRSIVMSDAGGNNSGHSLSNVNIVFSSTASTRVPKDTTIDSTVPQRPANYAFGSTAADETDTFPGAGPGALRFEPADFDAFNGINPNGDWKLFVVDDDVLLSGSISGGWQLSLTVPTIYTVTKAEDTSDGTCNSDCSLREAIAAAGNGDLIRFASPLFDRSQTITLNGTALSPTNDITIQGPGADRLSISGNNLSRVFDTSGINLSLSGLTVRDGLSPLDGGGIGQFGGALALRNVAVTGNRAGPGGFGGGVAGADLVANFVGCTFSDNSAPDSASAIVVQGVAYASLRLVNSTVSGNRSGTASAVFASSATGAPVDMEIVNSTIANNSAPNGGGLYVLMQGDGTGTASATLRNTIIANNTMPNIIKTDIGSGSIRLISQGYNLIGDAGAYFDNAVTDATTISNANPRLGPLNNNGGQVETHALLGGSPALDAGQSSGYPKDQRGVTRSFNALDAIGVPGDYSDIGATEMHAVFVSNTDDSGAGSLRIAMGLANLDGAGQDDILFDPDVFGATPQTINLAGALPDIQSSISVNGPGAKLLTVRRDTGGDYGVFSAGSGHEVAFSGLTMSNGRAADFGGGLVSFSRTSLAQVALTGNYAGTNGGGLDVIFADATVKDSTFSGNSAGSSGGGIAFEVLGQNTLRLTSATISGNDAPSGGGGLEEFSQYGGLGRVEIVNSTIAGNTAPSGGGIEAYSQGDGGSIESITLRNSIVANNTLPNLSASGNCAGCIAGIVSLGYNLTDDTTMQFLDQPTDWIDTDPLLRPLADNGGPTKTHALKPGSPALDSGNGSGSFTDQRGFERPYDQPGVTNISDGSDIGALEQDDSLFHDGFDG